jgi:ribosome modulation factor
LTSKARDLQYLQGYYAGIRGHTRSSNVLIWLQGWEDGSYDREIYIEMGQILLQTVLVHQELDALETSL